MGGQRDCAGDAVDRGDARQGNRGHLAVDRSFHGRAPGQPSQQDGRVGSTVPQDLVPDNRMSFAGSRLKESGAAVSQAGRRSARYIELARALVRLNACRHSRFDHVRRWHKKNLARLPRQPSSCMEHICVQPPRTGHEEVSSRFYAGGHLIRPAVTCGLIDHNHWIEFCRSFSV